MCRCTLYRESYLFPDSSAAGVVSGGGSAVQGRGGREDGGGGCEDRSSWSSGDVASGRG